MRLLVSCEDAPGSKCPAVYAEDDGTVVVQGELIGEPEHMLHEGTLPTGRFEARVRIPADVLRRAVLSQVLAYTVDLGGGKLWTAMPGDCAVVFPQEPVTTDKGPVAVDAPVLVHPSDVDSILPAAEPVERVLTAADEAAIDVAPFIEP